MMPFEGRRFAVAAPSRQLITRSGAPDFEAVEQGIRWLEDRGAAVSFWGPLVSRARFAGEDALRAACWQGAATSDADMVLALRGGYGFTRLLPMLDWDALAEAEVPAMGFSDFTAYQAALFTRTGRASWHGPTLSSFSRWLNDRDCLSAASIESFEACAGTKPQAWRGLAWNAGPDAPDATCEGVLWGGNLAMLASLAGTPWLDPERFAGGILYLEDVGESAYRIERMLLQLLDAGILGAQRAVLWGSFSGADRAAGFPGDFTLQCAMDYIRTRVPSTTVFLQGFPIGHGRDREAVPFGVAARLSASDGRASIRTAGCLP